MPVALLVCLTLLAASPPPALRAQAPAAGLRVLSKEGTRTLPIISANNQEYVTLDDVGTMFGLTVREDRLAGGVTLTSPSNRTLIITPDQAVVSVAGRLVSLSTPPVRQGNRWLLPLDLLQRGVGPILDTRMELRRGSRLLVLGDLRVPRVVARVEPVPGGMSAVFDSTPPTPSRLVADGGRLTVQYEADALDLGLPAVPSNEFLQALQPGDTPTTIRLVPGPKFGLHRATTSQPDAGTGRLTVDLLPSGTEPPPPAPATPATPAPMDPLPLPTAATGLRTIVLDPGHGGDETGVRGGAGTEEKDVTLAIARRLRAMIESRLGLRVFLTRDDDRLLPLDNRAAYANSQKADLFISIHANASPRPVMRGAEVYFLRHDPADDARGSGESAVDLPTLGGGTRTIDLIAWETAQLQHLTQSAALAGIVAEALGSRVEMAARPVQQAPLRVLVGANMPAVLVEVGYLSNPEQETALAAGSYQDRVAQGLFDAIVRYRQQFDRRPAAPTPQP